MNDIVDAIPGNGGRRKPSAAADRTLTNSTSPPPAGSSSRCADDRRRLARRGAQLRIALLAKLRADFAAREAAWTAVTSGCGAAAGQHGILGTPAIGTAPAPARPCRPSRRERSAPGAVSATPTKSQMRLRPRRNVNRNGSSARGGDIACGNERQASGPGARSSAPAATSALPVRRFVSRERAVLAQQPSPRAAVGHDRSQRGWRRR
jgi:hypothetical protein